LNSICNNPSLICRGYLLNPWLMPEPYIVLNMPFSLFYLPLPLTGFWTRSSPMFFFLIKHCDHKFCNLKNDSKTDMDFFFLLHNFMDIRFVLIIDLSEPSIQFFSFIIKFRTFTFSFKWNTLKLLFGVVNCQCQCSHALRPLLNKIRITWTQKLQYCNSQSDNLDGS
jgi:hypothetical protein